MSAAPPRLGVIAYGAAFTVLLPALLVLWAHGTAEIVSLPLPEASVARAAGAVLLLAGAGLMLAAMRALAVHGDGLPMNAFPPPRLVARGPYLLVAHPIYVGFVAACAGVALLCGSSSGLWLVTSAVALGCAALVLGYERLDLQGRFGAELTRASRPRPFFSLPPAEDRAPTPRERAGAWLLVLGAWTLAYEGTLALGVPARTLDPLLDVERLWPVWTWTVPIYASVYPAALAGVLAPRSARALRELCAQLLFAFALAAVCFLALPFVAPPRPFVADSMAGDLLAFDRAHDAPTGALPALHATWALLLAGAAARRRPAWRLPALAWGGAVAASCVTTGQHALLDVLAGALLAGAAARRVALWRALCAAAERVANSWREWRVGPLRILHHGGFAGVGAAVGLVLARTLTGTGVADLLAVAGAGLLGAALWAQYMEGSPALLRPFGYYGGVLGVALGGVLLALTGRDAWPALAGLAVAGPPVQAIGRLRCLVQGCCHGRPCPGDAGIRYRHPRSRVVRLTYWRGVPLYPTPLFSILANLGSGALLARAWWSGLPLPFLCGLYLLQNGLCRFVEEAYRGEPQTPRLLGLPIYQWNAVASVVAGAVLTAWPVAGSGAGVISSAASNTTLPLTFDTLAMAAGFGLLVSIAMGVDLPEGRRRFSRLA